MPEPSNQASLQRRANWIGVRTLRQRPKLVGETADGEPVFEIRSVRVVLRGLSPHFNRLSPCHRCGKEVAGAPVLTVADLERPLRPQICTDCVQGTGVSAVWEPAAAPPAAEPAQPAAAEPAVEEPAAAVAEPAAEEPAPAPADAGGGRLDVFEGHLRVVTDRVNDLGRALWALRAGAEERGKREEADRAVVAALRAEADERRQGEEATRAAVAELAGRVAAAAGVGEQVDGQRAELAAVVSAVADLRADLERLAEGTGQLARAHQELDRRLGEPAPVPAELTALAAAHQSLERRVEEAAAQSPHAARLSELEGRLAEQRLDLQAAIETSVRAHGAGMVRAHQELAEVQAGVLQRLDGLALQLDRVTSRMDAMASWITTTNHRLEALEDRAERASLADGLAIEVDPATSPAEGLLDTLERQLDAAAGRLAARSGRGPVE